MPSRFDDCFDTGPKRHVDLMPEDLIRPTSIADQFRSGGWTRLEKPVGGEPPPTDPSSPQGGNAGMAEPDGDEGPGYNVAAVIGPQ